MSKNIVLSEIFKSNQVNSIKKNRRNDIISSKSNIKNTSYLDKKLYKKYFSSLKNESLLNKSNIKSCSNLNVITESNQEVNHNKIKLLNKKRNLQQSKSEKLDLLKSLIASKMNKITNTNLSLNETINCIICMCNIEGNECFHLKCGHYFHNSCISDWIKEKANCPICKENIYMKVKTNGIDYLINLIRAERQFYELLNFGILLFSFFFLFVTIWKNMPIIISIRNFFFPRS